MSRLIALVGVALMLFGCGLTAEERRLNAEIRAWATEEYGEAGGAVWVRRFCADGYGSGRTPAPCTRNSMSVTEEIAFEKWHRQRDADGGGR